VSVGCCRSDDRQGTFNHPLPGPFLCGSPILLKKIENALRLNQNRELPVFISPICRFGLAPQIFRQSPFSPPPPYGLSLSVNRAPATQTRVTATHQSRNFIYLFCQRSAGLQTHFPFRLTECRPPRPTDRHPSEHPPLSRRFTVVSFLLLSFHDFCHPSEHQL